MQRVNSSTSSSGKPRLPAKTLLIMRIALLDSDLQQRKALESMLQGAGHECTAFLRDDALLGALKTEEPDLLIIHWQSRAEDLAVLASAWTMWTELPVLLIAGRSPDEAVLRQIVAGPADLLLKPLRRAELLMRLQVLMDRHRPGKLAEDTHAFGDYVFSPRSARVTLEGREVPLTQKEFELALLFFRHLGRPLSRAFIHESVWSQDAELSSRTMDTHVSRVRSKLSLKPERGFRLAPVYSFGYRLEQIAE